MKSTIEYRINYGDVAQVKTHLTACDSSFYPPLSVRTCISAYAQKITNNALRFEAWSDTKLVGLVAIYYGNTDNGHAFITNVSVLPSFHKQRIAYNLLEQSINYLFKKNILIFKLEVNKDNINALRLYQKLKFQPQEETNNSIIMLLELKQNNNNNNNNNKNSSTSN